MAQMIKVRFCLTLECGCKLILSLFLPSEECFSVGGGQGNDGFHSHKEKTKERMSISVVGTEP